MVARKSVIVITLAIFMTIFNFASGCAESGLTVIGSGKLNTWDFDHRDFTKIEAGSAFELDITKADSYLVRITFDDNLFEYLDVEKRGDTLHISFKPNHNYSNCTHKANITLPDLRELDLSGASHAEVKGFSSSHSMRFDLSGASNAHIDDYKAGDTRFEISGDSRAEGNMKIDDGKLVLSGASSIKLAGSANDISIEASGASNVMLEDFPVANAEVNLSGASGVTINTSGRLDYDLSGGSRLDTLGNPKLGKHRISGGSTIGQK